MDNSRVLGVPCTLKYSGLASKFKAVLSIRCIQTDLYTK